VDTYGLELRVGSRNFVRIDYVVEVEKSDESGKLERLRVADSAHIDPRFTPNQGWMSVHEDYRESAYKHWTAYVRAVEDSDPVFKLMERHRAVADSGRASDSRPATEQ